jgi:hypothetical protein
MNKNKLLGLIAIIGFIAVSITACFSDWAGEGTLTINVGGGNSRSVLDEYYELCKENNANTLKMIDYKITLSRNGKIEDTFTAKGNETIRRTVPTGQYSVLVEASIKKTEEHQDQQQLDGYNVGANIPFAMGTGSGNVKAGQNNSIPVKMGQFKYTVTLVTNNGDENEIRYVVPSDNILEFPFLVNIGYRCVLDGWYYDQKFEEQYFSGPITNNITLYAKWRPYEIGETGPAGGKIFHQIQNGFTMTDNNSIAYYLEAAPVDWNGNDPDLSWCEYVNVPPNYLIVTGTKTDKGSGRENTALILSAAASNSRTAPAAEACNEYEGGGFSDWFLPSKDELNLLIGKRDIVDGLNSQTYSSSSQYDDDKVWAFSGNDFIQYGKDYKANVRPIRAF